MRYRNIVLVGFKGAGKTTVGRKVAGGLGWPFVDTDVLILPSPREVYRRLGEAGFRAEEKRVLLGLGDVTRCVIATGGGMPCDPENAALLRKMGMVIHLKTPKEVVIERLKEMPKAACLEGRDFEEVYEERMRCYGELAYYTVNAEDELELFLATHLL